MEYTKSSVKIWMVLILSLMVLPVFGQFGGGSGTSADPYLISSVVHLNNIRGTAYLGKYYKQMVSLNLEKTNPANVLDWVSGSSYAVGDYVKYGSSPQTTYICIQATSSQNPLVVAYWTPMWESSKGWKPIGDAVAPFHGVYDGNGKTIANLYINRGASPTADNVYPSDGEDNIGLFGYLANGGAVANNYHVYIKDLGMLNPNVTGRRAVGSIVGRVLLPNTTPARSYTVYVERCYAIPSAGTATVKGFGATGGLVGANNSNARQRVPVIRFSYANVTVSATHPTNYTPNPADQVGTSGIYNPYNIKYGGLVGCNENGTTQDSFARGNVTGGDRVGGLAGCTIGGAIFRSYSTGTVTRNIQPGGSLPNYEGGIGGLVGRTAGSLPPGLGGTVAAGSCEDCYWDTQSSGQATSPGGTGMNTAQMKIQGNFNNWDFINVWGIDAGINDGYPYLRGAASTEHHYRTQASGNWNNPAIWQYSSDTLIWSNAVVTPDESNSLTITIINGHTVNVTQNVYIDATTIQTGATVQIDSGVTLQVDNGLGTDLTVNGILEVTGVFVPNINSSLAFGSSSELIYNGSVAQSTGDYFLDPVYNLTLDNSAGLTMENPVVIQNLFTVLSGTYSLGITATVQTDGVYSPAVKFFQFPPTGFDIEGYSSTMSIQPNFPDYVDRQWSINGIINDANPANRTKTITFYWTNVDDYDFDWTGIAPAVFVGLTKYSAIAYDTSTNTRYVTINYAFSQSKDIFKIGREDEETLPVVLSSFTASLNAYNYVQIQWVTQSETNVSGYRLYRGNSNDLNAATMLNAFIPGTNTSQQQFYLYTDSELEGPGLYYYWLENTDFDGSNSFHGPVSVNYEQPEASSPEVPITLGINSVYPNPFNPNTSIRFGLVQDTSANLVVYNSRGQVVRNLMNQSLAKGSYSITWNGRDENNQSVASGIYYLRLVAGKDSFTRKLMLMK